MRSLDLSNVPLRSKKAYDWKNSVDTLVPYEYEGITGVFLISNWEYSKETRRNRLTIRDLRTNKNYKVDSRYFKEFNFKL